MARRSARVRRCRRGRGERLCRIRSQTTTTAAPKTTKPANESGIPVKPHHGNDLINAVGINSQGTEKRAGRFPNLVVMSASEPEADTDCDVSENPAQQQEGRREYEQDELQGVLIRICGGAICPGWLLQCVLGVSPVDHQVHTATVPALGFPGKPLAIADGTQFNLGKSCTGRAFGRDQVCCFIGSALLAGQGFTAGREIQ